MQSALALDSTVVCRGDIFSQRMSFFIAQRRHASRPGRDRPARYFRNRQRLRSTRELIWCGFTNELLAGELENFAHVGIGFSAWRNCVCRDEQNFFAVWGHNYWFLSGSLTSSLPGAGMKGGGTLRQIPACSNRVSKSPGQNS